jgi:hypothetical protein
VALNVVAGVLHAAFKNITHPEFVADLLRAEALVFVSESEFPQFSFVPGRGGANFGQYRIANQVEIAGAAAVTG